MKGGRMFSKNASRLSMVVALVAFVGVSPTGGNVKAADPVYVSNTFLGNDSTGDGSKAKPYATLDKALTAGSTVRFLPNDAGIPYPLIDLGKYSLPSFRLEAEDGPSTTQIRGITMTGDKKFEVIGFTIVNPDGHGIYSNSNATSYFLQIRVANCVIAYCGGCGIWSGTNVAYATVQNSVIYQNMSDGIYNHDGGMFVANCIIVNNGRYGVDYSNLVSYSYFEGNGAASINVGVPTFNLVSTGLAFVNPNNCDFHLKHPNDDPADPGLFRQGHPGIKNPDGSRSDLGAYGGPDSARWFRRSASTRPVIGSVTTKAANDGTGNLKVTVQVKA
jgi:hypothetical protein